MFSLEATARLVPVLSTAGIDEPSRIFSLLILNVPVAVLVPVAPDFALIVHFQVSCGGVSNLVFQFLDSIVEAYLDGGGIDPCLLLRLHLH